MNVHQVRRVIEAIDEMLREDFAAGREARTSDEMIPELRQRGLVLPSSNTKSWVQGVRSTTIFHQRGATALTPADDPDV
jgi:hypothetical protein